MFFEDQTYPKTLLWISIEGENKNEHGSQMRTILNKIKRERSLVLAKADNVPLPEESG